MGFKDPEDSVRELKSKGVKIAVILISHNHFDHLDSPTVNALKKHYKSAAWYMMPVGSNKTMKVREDRVRELKWRKQQKGKVRATVDSEDKRADITFSCVPAQHWTKRKAFDDHEALWCGWVVEFNDNENPKSHVKRRFCQEYSLLVFF